MNQPKPFSIPAIQPPLPRTYWVVERKFLAGAYPGKEDPVEHEHRLSGLIRAGVRAVVNLMEENETNIAGEPFVPYQADIQRLASAQPATLTLLRFPIVDQNIPTANEMETILDAIDDSLSRDQPVYLHCFGGIGRTGTTVCCWLVRHGFADAHSVFTILQQLRTADIDRATWPAPENEEQRDFVRNWKGDS